jgi:hypothetical protein
LSKIKCFTCHKYGNYASQCPEKKGQGKTQKTTSIETHLDEFATKFEKEFSMFSCLSTNTNSRSAWYLDSGASHHMTWTHELFTSWSEIDSDLHVELGTLAKCGVEGVGTVRFQLESGGFLEVEDVLYVPELKKNFLSVSVLEDMGFSITFQRGKVLICLEGDIPDTTINIGVREGRLYRLQGKPVRGSKGILDHGSMSVTEDEERRLWRVNSRRMSRVHNFQCGESTFRWEEGVIPFQSCQETELVWDDIDGCSGAGGF